MIGAYLGLPLVRGEVGRIRAHFRPTPWPLRPPAQIAQSHYWQGEARVQTIGGPGGVAIVFADTPLFCARPETSMELPGFAVPLVRRQGDVTEIYGGLNFVAGFPATAIRLQLYGGTSVYGPYHYVRPPVDLTAAQALDGGYGLGDEVATGMKFWFARLQFVNLVAVPAGGYTVRWWVAT